MDSTQAYLHLSLHRSPLENPHLLVVMHLALAPLVPALREPLQLAQLPLLAWLLQAQLRQDLLPLQVWLLRQVLHLHRLALLC